MSMIIMRGFVMTVRMKVAGEFLTVDRHMEVTVQLLFGLDRLGELASGNDEAGTGGFGFTIERRCLGFQSDFLAVLFDFKLQFGSGCRDTNFSAIKIQRHVPRGLVEHHFRMMRVSVVDFQDMASVDTGLCAVIMSVVVLMRLVQRCFCIFLIT